VSLRGSRPELRLDEGSSPVELRWAGKHLRHTVTPDGSKTELGKVKQGVPYRAEGSAEGNRRFLVSTRLIVGDEPVDMGGHPGVKVWK